MLVGFYLAKNLLLLHTFFEVSSTSQIRKLQFQNGNYLIAVHFSRFGKTK